MRCYDTRHTVAALRKIVGLSQGELAAMVGRSKRTIQAVEIGRLKISEDLAARIAHETGVAMHWLLKGDYNASPSMAFSDAPYTKKVFDDTRAAISAGKNPNPLVISLSQEGRGVLEFAPVALMAKFVEQTNSLLHPQMDYLLASILSSIFAAVKAGQARIAIYRLAEFSKAMKTEFGQRFDGEFTNDATVVFEQGLERLKMAELLLNKNRRNPSSPVRPAAGKQSSVCKDPLNSREFALGLQEYDVEALWASLNGVGERIKARRLSTQKSFEGFEDQIMEVFRKAKSGGSKSKPITTSKAPAQGAAKSRVPDRK